jgi:hypothetical protein
MCCKQDDDNAGTRRQGPHLAITFRKRVALLSEAIFLILEVSGQQMSDSKSLEQR